MVAGAVSFGGGAAFAATHGSSPAAKPPVSKAKTPQLVSNVHYPCHNHGARLTAAQL